MHCGFCSRPIAGEFVSALGAQVFHPECTHGPDWKPETFKPIPTFDWTAFRNDCAMRIAAGLAANQSEWNGLSPSVQGVQIAQDSVVIADALIAELKKGQRE